MWAYENQSYTSQLHDLKNPRGGRGKSITSWAQENGSSERWLKRKIFPQPKPRIKNRNTAVKENKGMCLFLSLSLFPVTLLMLIF